MVDGWSFGKCVLFSFVGFSLNKKRALFMSLPIELSCAVNVGYVRAGIFPVQQDRDYVIFCLEPNFCVPFRRVYLNSRGDKWGPRGYVSTVDLS